MAFRTAMAVSLLFPVIAIQKGAGHVLVDRVLFASLLTFVALSFPLSYFRDVHFTLFLVPVIILIFIVHIFLPTRLVFSVVLGT
jgi:hypothetical protein